MIPVQPDKHFPSQNDYEGRHQLHTRLIIAVSNYSVCFWGVFKLQRYENTANMNNKRGPYPCLNISG